MDAQKHEQIGAKSARLRAFPKKAVKKLRVLPYLV